MSEKHKRNDVQPLTDTEKVKALETAEKIFDCLEPKQQHIMAEWLDTWSKYISFEKGFMPQRLKYYKRGEIVLAHFGYNVGSELGGTHFAVVVENNNNKSNSNVAVVPLSSLDDGKTEKDLHCSEVYLGKVIPNSDKLSYARPMQIRAISKLRIIKPKFPSDSTYKISAEQLSEIDKMIIKLFTKQN